MAIFGQFYVDKILANPYISYYLPQHCLYFFPEPHKLFIVGILVASHSILWLFFAFECTWELPTAPRVLPEGI